MSSIFKESADRGEENNSNQEVTNIEMGGDDLKSADERPDDHHEKKSGHDPDVPAAEKEAQKTKRLNPLI